MTAFFEPGLTRVALLPVVDSPSMFPTVAECNAGILLTPYLSDMDVTNTTDTIDSTKWMSDQRSERPTRFATNIGLRGQRHTTAAADVLWQAVSTFRLRRFLVIRRGTTSATAWAAGNPVEVYEVRLGKRSMEPTGQSAAYFTCPLFVQAQNDAAVVT